MQSRQMRVAGSLQVPCSNDQITKPSPVSLEAEREWDDVPDFYWLTGTESSASSPLRCEDGSTWPPLH